MIKDLASKILKGAGIVAGVVTAAAVGVVLLAINAKDDDDWMQTASEDELRTAENEMQAKLSKMDYDSDEYLQLDLKRIDVVNEIASRSSSRLPHREHGWYLPNDDDD